MPVHPPGRLVGSLLLLLHGTVRVQQRSGTAREVISRILSEFQRRGLIEQARGEVHLTGRAGLEQLISSADAQA